jgi:hypothetical protein
MKLLLVLLALLALFQMTVSASAPGVKAEATAGTSIALVVQDEEIFKSVKDLVVATRDNRAAELFVVGTAGAEPASRKIKITIECCKPFRLTVEIF